MDGGSGLKLLPLSTNASLNNVVLLLNGTFCPIHTNHIRSLILARQELEERRGCHVIGAFISPTHDENICRKLPNQSLSAAHRVRMIELATSESDWINAYAWQSQQPRNPGAVSSKKNLEQMLSLTYSNQVTVLSVCGADSLPKLKRAFMNERVVAIVNRDIGFDVDEWLNAFDVRDYRRNVILVRDGDGPTDISSTRIRAMINADTDPPARMLHPKVLAYHKTNGINYRKKFMTASQSFDTLWNEPTMNIEWDNLVDLHFSLGKGRQCSGVNAMSLSGHDVAVKVFELGNHPNRILQQARREMRVFHALGVHPNIIRCYGTGIDAFRAFIVMERSDQGTFDNFIEQHRVSPSQTTVALFPPPEWQRLCQQIALGLAHLESAGILHRDLKLNNILICGTLNHEATSSSSRANSFVHLTAKISDFGVSRFVNETQSVARGSLRHYAPEAVGQEGEAHYYTSASEVFMFGQLLHEAAHGARTIWQEMNTGAAIQNTLANKRPPFTAPCYDHFTQLVLDCVAHIPSARPTFKEIIERLSYG